MTNPDGTYALDQYGNVQWSPGLSWETVLLMGGYVNQQGRVNNTLWNTQAFICEPTRGRKTAGT